jgi:hypothetical protein
VGGLDDLDALAGNGVAVAGHHEALKRARPGVLDGACHRGRRFARPDHNRPALRQLGQMGSHNPGRQGRLHGCVEHHSQQLTWLVRQ